MKFDILGKLILTLFSLVLFANTANASVKIYDFFYEFRTLSDPPMTNCLSGRLHEIQEKVKLQFSERNDGIKLNFVCISKSHLLRSADSEITLLIPYLESGEMTAEKLGKELKVVFVSTEVNCKFKSNNCLKFQDTTIGAPHPFRKFAYNYSVVEQLSFVTENTYTTSSIQLAIDELKKNTLLVKLLQVRLKGLGYSTGQIDGAFGSLTKLSLAEYINNNVATDSNGQFVTTEFIDGLFPNLLKYQSDRENSSLSATEPGQVSEAENLETSSVATIENRKELVAPDENSEIVSETPDETEPVELGHASSDGATDTEQLELRVLDLRKQLEEQQDLYASLKDSYDEISSLYAELQQPISQTWTARVSQKSFNIAGKLPDGKPVDLTVLERSFFERYCTLSIDQPLEAQFGKHVKQEKCFILTLKEYDEDTSSSREYDAASNTLTIPVLEKQIDLITSITSDSLDNFDVDDTNSCWVGLKLLDEENRDTGTSIELWMQVVDVDGRIEAKLTDFEQVAKKEIPWRNRKMQLADLTPDGQTTSCMITNTKAFDVISDDSEPNDKATTARIDRLGNVVLTNLPLVKKKAPELHVFLDTLVGPEGDVNYGFNGAINSEEERETQKLYFEGFLNGVQTFLSKRTDIEKVTIYQTIMQGKNRELQELQTFTRADAAGDTHLITDDFIAEYISDFKAGIPGEFDNKKRKLPRLLKSNGNSLFISFGSSGLTDDKVCQRKIPRQDYTENSVIFDVVPSFTVRQLSEANELETIARGFAFKCSNQDRIVPLKPLRTMAMVEVNEVIDIVLGGWRY